MLPALAVCSKRPWIVLTSTLMVFSLLWMGCGEAAEPEEAAGPTLLFRDVTRTHIPAEAVNGATMDAEPADLDADGDLDLMLAQEHMPNVMLLNDSTGHFANASDRIPDAEHDSEDVGIADFDGDGDLDVVVVSEDDQTNEFYLNDGTGHFTDASARWPVQGTSNAVAVADLTDDGAPDILVGNNGQNFFLVNDGTGHFTDATAARMPQIDDVTQDLELGDVDGDDDADLIVGNEGNNRLLLNDGTGHFTVPDSTRIPMRSTAEETREADFGDVDGDGDLDLLFANVRLFVEDADLQNRLLINDGNGFFTDATDRRLPDAPNRSLDGDFIDVDADGDLDIVTANVGIAEGQISGELYRVFLNDGAGAFRAAEVLPEGTSGNGFDVEGADFSGDGRIDLYLASRGSIDRLLLGRPLAASQP